MNQKNRVACFLVSFAGLLGLGVFAIAASIPRDSPSLLNESPPGPGPSETVPVVTTNAEWKSAMSLRNVVLYVDCEWNQSVTGFGQTTFHDFAHWAHRNSDYHPMTIVLDTDPTTDPMLPKLQELWDKHSLGFGINTWGGAGRIVWFKDGELVRTKWYDEVFYGNTEKGVASLQTASHDLFAESAPASANSTDEQR